MENIELRKDNEWSVIDSEPCKIIEFTPMASVIDGKVSALNIGMPYASITIECKKIQGKITGFVTHKRDFLNLWAAFKERTVKDNEEVIILWSKKHYKIKWLKFFSGFFPKLWVMVCQKGTFDLITDPSYKPELQGEARFLAERPLVEWKPGIKI